MDEGELQPWNYALNCVFHTKEALEATDILWNLSVALKVPTNRSKYINVRNVLHILVIIWNLE
jgi:hypothetical protein